jgi:AcrR family transcriptional regulator
MAHETMAGPRARYRRQVRTEVQQLAWAQIAEAGASALSLKAIAKQMGVTAPALYRYFASRDDLLTELILSAYRDLAELVETTVETTDAAPVRLTAMARALRDWALANPHRYLLIYGTPVPGYAAPAEATELAARTFAPILAGYGVRPVSELDPNGLDPALRRALAFWTRLHGIIGLEVAGHFNGARSTPRCSMPRRSPRASPTWRRFSHNVPKSPCELLEGSRKDNVRELRLSLWVNLKSLRVVWSGSAGTVRSPSTKDRGSPAGSDRAT